MLAGCTGSFGAVLYMWIKYGKPDASNSPTGDMRTQLLLGHLPALLAGPPKTALVIGLGSGVTAGALAT
jgi:hypothetical protein